MSPALRGLLLALVPVAMLAVAPGPHFVQIKVLAEKVPLVLPPHDGVLLKARFRRALLGASADVLPEKG